MAVDRSVAQFERSTNENFDEVKEILEDRLDQVQELKIADGLLNDEQVLDLDDLLRIRHADVRIKALKLPNNNLSSRSSSSLASIVQTTQTLVELDLSDNQVKAEGLLQLKHTLCQPGCMLTMLNLSNNKLGSKGAIHIASIVKENRSIEELLISKNDLGKQSKSLKALGESLTENPVLTSLDLSFNKITSRGMWHLAPVFDRKVSKSRIKEVDLTYNSIRDDGVQNIAAALLEGNNTCLRRLNLSRTEMTSEGAIYLAHLLKFSYSLEELIISQNKIGNEGVVQLCLGILGSRDQNGTALKRLDLETTVLDDGSAPLLRDMLQGNDTLEHLNLAYNGICSEGAKALADALHSNQTLRVLDLEKNQIRDSGAIALAESLCRPSCRLETLGWKKNQISKLGQGRLMAAFQLRENQHIWLNEFLHEIRRRRHIPIHLFHRKLSDEEVIAIVRQLKVSCPRVPSLCLCGESISARGIKMLTKDLIATNQANIQRIDLKRTSIGDLGAAAFAQALQSNNTLRVLSLQKCMISSQGLQFLSRAIAKTRTLTRLDLSGNDISDDGAQELFDTILDPPHYSLRGVVLSGNLITDRGIITLRSFGNLELVDLSHNRLTDSGALDLGKAALQSSAKLKVLKISHNLISTKGITALGLFLPPGALQNFGQQPSNQSGNQRS